MIQLEDIDCYEDEIKAVERRAWFSKGQQLDLKKLLKDYEKDMIENAIKESKSYTEAAERLGISKQALNNKINMLGIQKNKDNVQNVSKEQ